jgi:arylsulfatase A-like enzyme
LGFRYFYGFIAGETSQYEPRLFENTNPIEPPRTPEERLRMVELHRWGKFSGNLVGFSWDFVGFHQENHDLMRTYEDEPTEMICFFGTSGRFCSLDFVT